ncbi:MAG: 4a-hydroxytetrahydrobiopterin dehydratase [Thermoleophilia bacterium]|nr:4a-hydroxytetrahydrobiopterin dehydratase [Thermoleophilia bacterium]
MPLLGDDEISIALALLPGWGLEAGALAKDYVFPEGFARAIAFVDAVAAAAEVADHHPDIDVRWNTVTLRWVTHSVGGITPKDTALAAECDRLAVV